MNKYFNIVTVLQFLAPVSVLGAITNVVDFQDLLFALLGKLGYFFWIASLACFFWGLVKFIRNAADTAEHEAGKNLMIWGLVSFLVLISLWGIVQIV